MSCTDTKANYRFIDVNTKSLFTSSSVILREGKICRVEDNVAKVFSIAESTSEVHVPVGSAVA